MSSRGRFLPDDGGGIGGCPPEHAGMGESDVTSIWEEGCLTLECPVGKEEGRGRLRKRDNIECEGGYGPFARGVGGGGVRKTGEASKDCKGI